MPFVFAGFQVTQLLCEALSSRGQVSEIRGSSSKWGRDPLFTKFVKSYSNEEFSIHTTMIFKVDSNRVHLRF